VAVLTEFGARKILATEAVIGQTVRIGGNEFEIIGIVKSESGLQRDTLMPVRFVPLVTGPLPVLGEG